MEIYINIFIMFCMFVMGSLFGSFFSLATYRIPRHQDIVKTRSYCPNCKHRLEFFDLIPILSFIIRGGKCKYCKEKISLRYPLLEITNGVVFLVFYFIFGYTLNLFLICITYAILFVLIGSRLMSKKMTDEEKIEVQELKLSSKKGVFVIELVVALIIFTVYVASALIIVRNSTKKGAELIARGNAITVAVSAMEQALSKTYDELYSSSSSSTGSNNIIYDVTTDVTKYSDIDLTKKDLVKIIQVNVKYMYNGNSYDFTLKTLKGKEI